MAFNGSGTYNLPAADLPVSGQLVSSTKMNSILSDLATALSLCLARDGQSTMSGTLKMGSQIVTGLGNGAVGAPAIAFANSTTTGVYSTGSNKGALAANGALAVEWDENGLTDSAKVGGVAVGYRNIPITATLADPFESSTTNNGKCYVLTTNIIVKDDHHAAGDVFSVYNNTAGALSIIQDTNMSLRLAGTASTGNRSLASRGFATVWVLSQNVAIISGSGLT